MARSLLERLQEFGGLLQKDFGNIQNQTGGILSNIPQSAILGSAIYGQGIKGKDPFASLLPAVTQTAQTSSFLDQMSQRKKSQEFVDKYKTTLPEGSTIRALMEANPDKAFDFIAKKELATLNAQGKRSSAYKIALEIGLTPGTPEFNNFIKAQTVKTDAFAQSLQTSGIIQSKGERDKVVKDLRYVSQIRNQFDVLKDKLDEDPTLSGGVGAIRRGGNKIGTLLKDLGVNVEEFLPEGITKEFIFDKDIPTISALENTVAAGYAKVLYPGQKITNLQIQQAKKIVNLTGLTGSEEVKERLDQLGREMDVFINTNKSLLGEQPKRFRINPETNNLEEY